MTSTQMVLQSRALNISAKKHEEQGNTLLASWMRESAEHFKNMKHEIDSMLDDMALGNYERSRRSRREEYAHDWFDYEEEYSYNFCGDN